MRRIAHFFRATCLWILIFPTAVTFLGTASNQLVLVANGDRFPVLLNHATVERLSKPKITEDGEILPPRIGPDGTFIDGVHCVMTSDTHLNALADIFDFHVGWFSVGDGLLELGGWLDAFCPFVWIAFVIWKLNIPKEA